MPDPGSWTLDAALAAAVVALWRAWLTERQTVQRLTERMLSARQHLHDIHASLAQILAKLDASERL